MLNSSTLNRAMVNGASAVAIVFATAAFAAGGGLAIPVGGVTLTQAARSSWVTDTRVTCIPSRTAYGNSSISTAGATSFVSLGLGSGDVNWHNTATWLASGVVQCFATGDWSNTSTWFLTIAVGDINFSGAATWDAYPNKVHPASGLLSGAAVLSGDGLATYAGNAGWLNAGTAFIAEPKVKLSGNSWWTEYGSSALYGLGVWTTDSSGVFIQTHAGFSTTVALGIEANKVNPITGQWLATTSTFVIPAGTKTQAGFGDLTPASSFIADGFVNRFAGQWSTAAAAGFMGQSWATYQGRLDLASDDVLESTPQHTQASTGNWEQDTVLLAPGYKLFNGVAQFSSVCSLISDSYRIRYVTAAWTDAVGGHWNGGVLSKVPAPARRTYPIPKQDRTIRIETNTRIYEVAA